MSDDALIGDYVRLERRGTTGVLTLNRPDQRNILTGPMVDAIGAALDDLENDGTTRCLVITGAGKAFCAGAELATLQAAGRGDFAPVEHVYEGFLRVLHSPLATIAAVNGPAVGAGFNLALACDIRLAGPRALFDTRFAQLQLHPGGGHVWMLARAVGQQKATLACLFGQTWDAERGVTDGLVAAAHPVETLVDAGVELGDRLSGLDVEFARSLIGTLRETFATTTHEQALADETDRQRWSTTLPGFSARMAELLAPR
jgi:enoyl-CoA hydratase